MKVSRILEQIASGGCDTAFEKLYGNARITEQRTRWIRLGEVFIGMHGDIDAEEYASETAGSDVYEEVEQPQLVTITFVEDSVTQHSDGTVVKAVIKRD